MKNSQKNLFNADLNSTVANTTAFYDYEFRNNGLFVGSSFFFSFLEWGETESTWYVGHCLAYCTSSGWQMMSMEQSVEWELGRETEVLGENLPQFHVAHHESHMTWPWLEPGPPRWEAGD
jgi:hypothetical protein